MRSLRILPLALITLSFALAACSQEQGSAQQGQEAAPAQGAAFVGKVAETMDAGGYTYVRVESNGESVWAAGPETPVSVGDELAIDTSMFMPDFHSDTLDRTFERLYFVNELTAPGAGGGEMPSNTQGQMPAGHGSDMGSMEMPPSHGAPKVAMEKDFSGIEVPEGGLKVAELWEQRNQLEKQDVVVRGRVVKYNGGIMGRNWIHLQDGSGSEADGTHDLVVTTDAKAAPGDVITVRGTVVVDQDFGSGYRYALLLEKASIE